MTYEKTKEDKARRKEIPTKDFGLGRENVTKRRLRAFMERHNMKITIAGFVACVWLSGFFANSSTDMKFESLLVFVIGIVFVMIRMGSDVRKS